MEQLLARIAKYNCWNGNTYSTGMVRQYYLAEIENYLDNKIIKVLIGQRRSGKSFIMRQIIEMLIKTKAVNPQNIFYLNKEYLAYDEVKTANDLNNLFLFYKEKLNVSGKIYIFIDEIQNISEWERFVNSYAQDFTSEYEIFVTGSNATMLSGELASLLSGRYIEFEIFPFSYAEFLSIKNLEAQKSSLINYLNEGGLPELSNFKTNETKRNYIESLKNTIILRDIVLNNSVNDLPLLEELFQYLIRNIGNLTSINSIVNYFKNKGKRTSYETVAQYINYFEQAFVLKEVERYNIRGKSILGGERKYYVNDLAFKNYIFGNYAEDIGYNLENFVFNSLQNTRYKVFTGVLPNGEIDFIAEKNNRKIYIQVAYLLSESTTIAREYGNLQKIDDNFEKYVVSLDDFEFQNKDGIKHLQAWNLGQIL